MSAVLWFLIDMAVLAIAFELGKFAGLKDAERLFGKGGDR